MAALAGEAEAALLSGTFRFPLPEQTSAQA